MDTNPYQAPTSNVADLGVGSGIEVTWAAPVGIWVVRWLLRKSWSDCRIVLLPVSK